MTFDLDEIANRGKKSKVILLTVAERDWLVREIERTGDRDYWLGQYQTECEQNADFRSRIEQLEEALRFYAEQDSINNYVAVAALRSNRGTDSGERDAGVPPALPKETP